MNHNTTMILVMALSAVGVIGDTLLKKASHGGNTNYTLLILGVLVYSSTAIGWFVALKHMSLTSVGVVYGVSTILLLALVGVCLGESLTSTEVLGLVTGVITILLLFRFA